MSMFVTVRPASEQDWEAIAALLTAARLPLAGGREHVTGFLTAWQGPDLVGVAGLEIYGDAGLLRSVAVTESARGTGLGQQLVWQVLRTARERGLKTVALLTTTAPGFFPRFGFTKADRNQLPAALESSAEFRGACPASAIAMLVSMMDQKGGASK